MYQKILVPLDGSKLAELALPYADKLARRLGSEITLITVLIFGQESDEGQYQHLHKVYMQKMVNTFQSKRTKVKSVIVTGSPGEEIVDYAEREDIDLIVMGTRGKSALKRWALGSVADKVVNLANCPVALITTDDIRIPVLKTEILRKALIVLDSAVDGEVVIPYVQELASKLKINVVLLRMVDQEYEYYEGADDFSSVPVDKKRMASVRDRSRRYLRKLATSFLNKGIQVEVKVITRKSNEDIVRVASRIDADIIAMATRGRTGIGRWIFGSVRDKIVDIGNVLVLLVRIQEQQYTR